MGYFRRGVLQPGLAGAGGEVPARGGGAGAGAGRHVAAPGAGAVRGRRAAGRRRRRGRRAGAAPARAGAVSTALMPTLARYHPPSPSSLTSTTCTT